MTKPNRSFHFILMILLMFSFLLAACKPPSSASGKPKVVVTTTMLTDVVKNIAGDRIEVIGLLKAGTDPHTYRLVPKDVQEIARSQMVLMNGLGLEGKMGEGLRSAGEAQVLEVSQGVKPLDDPAHPGNPDPHIWFDVGRWRLVAENVRAALETLDPEGAPYYKERTALYLKELDALEARIKRGVGCIPQGKRKLVTSHDAFQYFGHAYGVEVRALQGISTEDEASAAAAAAVVDYVRAHGLPAIFTESSVSPKAMEMIRRETGIKGGGELYSDSVGPTGSGADTYVGMVDHNVKVLVEGLGGPAGKACLEGQAMLNKADLGETVTAGDHL